MKQADEQREAFEAAYIKRFGLKIAAEQMALWRAGDTYADRDYLTGYWHGWKAALAAALPPAAVQAGPSVKRIRETAQHLRENSLRLARYPGMTDEARARELAALYIEEIAWVHEQTTGVDEGTLTAGKQGGDGVAMPSDAARLDYLQRTGSTVELLPGFPGDPMQFRIGGRRTAVNADVRAAIDAAIDGVSAAGSQVNAAHPPMDSEPTK